MLRKKLFPLLLALTMALPLAVPAMAGGETPAPDSPQEDGVVILYTNDVHTYIDNTAQMEDGTGTAGLRYSTVAALKGSYENALLVDAGDHIQGTAYGSMDQGAAIIRLMNAAGYDLATLGNHEFDYGMEGAMNAMEWAQFDYVSANFFHERNGVAGERVLQPYKVFEVNGVKVAFVGVTTPETFTSTTPSYFQDEDGKYIYGIAGGEDGAALYAAVQQAIDAASAQADYVIGLGHLGDDPASYPWTSTAVIANTRGFDAFIDGHSHSTVEGRQVADRDGRPVLLTQTGEYLNAVGRMTISAGGGVATELLHYADLTSLTPDAGVAAIEDAWIEEIDRQLGQVIGYSQVSLDNYDGQGSRLVRSQETNSGDFAADALYYLFDNMGLKVDFAIMNGGGVRNTAITGELSYQTCKDIHTFGNVACLLTVTGQQMLDALEWGARSVGVSEEGSFLHVSGLKYSVDTVIPSTVRSDDKGVWTGGPTGEYRVKDVQVLNTWTGEYEPLDLAASYNLAGYNYTLRDLGGGFAMFDGAVTVLDYVMEDYMVLANYIQSFPVDRATGLPTITAQDGYGDVNGDGRITILKDVLDGYADVDRSAWYADAARFVIANGVMTGTGQGFEPVSTVTRATVLQTLYNMEGRPAPQGALTDVEGMWYADAANWAAGLGLAEGAGFGADAVILRAEIAGLLADYCALKGLGAQVGETIIDTAVDYDQIPAEFLEDMTFCYNAGLLLGNQNSELMPAGQVSRAEFAQVLKNLTRFMGAQAESAA